ncbi:MAG: hypothetical protein HeimC3_25900 [Candidatus Heimdallarchaeota archaeon LC_3]|nr:MAG: hypothetical protein HeimC3_25900 [Candidatus Heimdallarchaeota archaeon LC_3]
MFLGIDMKTLQKGVRDLQKALYLDKKRIRKSGGSRKSKEKQYPKFSDKLEALTEDHIAGDPMSNKRWV